MTSRIRRGVRGLLCLAVVATILVPAVPASAAPRLTVLVTRPVGIVHQGVRYQVRLEAMRMGRDELVSVSMRRTVDPDGRGPLRSRQELTWLFEGLSGALLAADDLSTATLSTARQLAPFGGAGYRFTAAKRPLRSCGGTDQMVTGRLRGSLTLRTRSGLGTITLANVGATLFRSQGRCDQTSGANPSWPCPPAGRAMFGLRMRGGQILMASGNARAPKAHIFTGDSLRLVTHDRSIGATLDRSVTTTVPGRHVRVGDDLRTGIIRGAPGTFTRGRATFSSTGRASTSTEPCGARRERTDMVSTMRPGVLGGTFRTLYAVGGRARLADAPLRGAAGRFTVIAR